MGRFSFSTDDPNEAQRLMAVLLAGGAGQASAMAPPPGRPAAPASAPPPPPGASAPPPPPAAPAPAPSPANPRLDNVLKLMDAYSRAGHGVAGARKVLAKLGVQRAQDADDAGLDWLAQAFANTSWVPE